MAEMGNSWVEYIGDKQSRTGYLLILPNESNGSQMV